MCYNVKALLESQLKRARKNGMNQDADALQQELFTLGKGNYTQVSGFTYPDLIIYNNSDNRPLRSVWGLVPQSVKDNDPAVFRKRFNTLNARGETIFTSPAFRDSAESKHCLVYVDGFYDHHHYAGGKYPFFIHLNDDQPFALAGLWAEWINPLTKAKLISFTIVTTNANQLMTRIHNNPDREGPRMPVILSEDLADEWLKPGLTSKGMKEFLIPIPDDQLAAHTVKPLSGKNAIKNDPAASEEYRYEDLKMEG